MGKRWSMSETATLEPETKQNWSSWLNPVLTPDQWGEVRRAVEAGMGMPEAAKQWGVDYEAVKKRAQREEWLTDSRIKMLAEKLKAEEALKIERKNAAEGKSLTVPQAENGQKTAGEAILPQKSALESVAASLEGYRSRTLLKLAKLAEKGVEKAIDANLNIENWQDAKIAAELALKLHAPQAGNSVQVNVLTDGSASFEVENFPVIEAEES